MTNDSQRLRDARSYDGAANVYERVNAPRYFDPPARALVQAVSPSFSARVLDVGCGTGAVSRAARAATGAGAAIVAIDPSLDMLRAARRGGVESIVNAALPDLPFAHASFDAVLCAFVLTHLDDPDAALLEMMRVLRPGGSVGASAWSTGDDDFNATWSRIVECYVSAERMTQAADVILPNEARFSKPDGLVDALRRAGFASVQRHDVDLPFRLTVDEFVEGREVCASGRALQALLAPDDWTRFRGEVRGALSSRFPRGVEYTRRVFIATGRVA